MASIQQMDFGFGKVAPVGLCSDRDEVGVVLPTPPGRGLFLRKYASKAE
jgi:hypothetical protein